MDTTITLPADYSVTSRDTFVTVDVTKLSADIIAKLTLYGLTQKVGDSASGALAAAGFAKMSYADLPEVDQKKVQEHAFAAMDSTLTSLYAGEWSERRAAGPSISPQETREIRLFGEALRRDEAEAWKTAFKPLAGADRTEALIALFAEQDDDVREAYTAEAKRQLADEAKTAKKLGGLKLAVNLPK